MLDDRQCQIEFGKFIRAGREKQKMFQSQIAELLDITQQYYSTIENGARNVDFVLALKICKILNLNMEDFIRVYMK